MSKLIKPLTAEEQKRIGRRTIALMPLAFCADVLAGCSAIILSDEPGSPLLYPDVVFEAGDPDGPLVNCTWDDEGLTYELDFEAADNPDGGWVDIKYGTMWLREQDGWLSEIGILARHISDPTGDDLLHWASTVRLLVPTDDAVTEIQAAELRSTTSKT